MKSARARPTVPTASRSPAWPGCRTPWSQRARDVLHQLETARCRARPTAWSTTCRCFSVAVRREPPKPAKTDRARRCAGGDQPRRDDAARGAGSAVSAEGTGARIGARKDQANPEPCGTASPQASRRAILNGAPSRLLTSFAAALPSWPAQFQADRAACRLRRRDDARRGPVARQLRRGDEDVLLVFPRHIGILGQPVQAGARDAAREMAPVGRGKRASRLMRARRTRCAPAATSGRAPPVSAASRPAFPARR